jgi:hypothetical protein
MTAFFTDRVAQRPSARSPTIGRRLSAEASGYPEVFPSWRLYLWRRAVAGPVRTTDVRIRELVAAD